MNDLQQKSVFWPILNVMLIKIFVNKLNITVLYEQMKKISFDICIYIYYCCRFVMFCRSAKNVMLYEYTLIFDSYNYKRNIIIMN